MVAAQQLANVIPLYPHTSGLTNFLRELAVWAVVRNQNVWFYPTPERGFTSDGRVTAFDGDTVIIERFYWPEPFPIDAIVESVTAANDPDRAYEAWREAKETRWHDDEDRQIMRKLR
jgi:hypothetical protein